MLITKIFFILILLPSLAFGATYYVVPSGTAGNVPTSPYDSWKLAANDPTTIITTGNGTAGPHSVYIKPGTYTTYFNIANVNWQNGSIYGVAATAYDASCNASACLAYPAYRSDVVFNVTAAQNGLNANASGLTMKNFTLQGTGSGNDAVYCTSANFTLDNVALLNNGRYSLRVSTGSTGLNIKKLFLSASRFDSVVSPVYIQNDASGAISYSVFKTSNQYSPTTSGYMLAHTGTGTINIYNSTFLGGRGATLASTGTGYLNVYNSYIPAGIWLDDYVVYRSGGTVTLNNSFVGAGFGSLYHVFNGTVTNNSPITQHSKDFISNTKTGLVSFNVDDYDSLTTAQTVESLLSARGMQGTYFVQAAYMSSILSSIQAMNTRGVMEIGVHGYSHTSLGLTGNTWSITKAAHTINVDRTNNQIVVSGASPVTVAGFKSKTLTAIRTELAAGGCTNGSPVANLDTNTLGEVLADSAGAQASPYTPQLLIDASGATGLYYVEIVYAKQVAEATTGFTMYSFAPPFGQTSTTIESIIQNAGYTGSRAAYNAAYWQSGVSPYQIPYLSTTTYIKALDASTNDLTHMIASQMAEGGGVVSLITHTADGATDAQLAMVLNILKQYPEISVWKIKDIASYIKTSPTFTSVPTYSACTASTVPFQCCTGVGTSTCYQKSWSTDNANLNLTAPSTCKFISNKITNYVNYLSTFGRSDNYSNTCLLPSLGAVCHNDNGFGNTF